MIPVVAATWACSVLLLCLFVLGTLKFIHRVLTVRQQNILAETMYDEEAHRNAVLHHIPPSPIYVATSKTAAKRSLFKVLVFGKRDSSNIGKAQEAFNDIEQANQGRFMLPSQLQHLFQIKNDESDGKPADLNLAANAITMSSTSSSPAMTPARDTIPPRKAADGSLGAGSSVAGPSSSRLLTGGGSSEPANTAARVFRKPLTWIGRDQV